MQFGIIPTKGTEVLHQPNITLVLLVRRAVFGVGMLRIAPFERGYAVGWNAFKSVVPIDGIVGPSST